MVTIDNLINQFLLCSSKMGIVVWEILKFVFCLETILLFSGCLARGVKLQYRIVARFEGYGNFTQLVPFTGQAHVSQQPVL